jgi:hypothetical protein
MTSATLSKEVEEFWMNVSTEIKNLNMKPEDFNPTALENYYEEKRTWWEKTFINNLIDEARMHKSTRSLSNFLLNEYSNIILYDLNEQFNKEKQKFLSDFSKGINYECKILRKRTIKEIISCNPSVLTNFEQYYKQRSNILREELGHSCLNTLYVETNNIDVQRLTKICFDVLHLTKDTYQGLQKKMLNEDSNTTKAEWHDILYTQKNTPFNQCFKEFDTQIIFSAVSSLNIHDITIHKSDYATRPSSLVIDVPKEIYIFVQNEKGPEYLQSLMHEVGHGIFYSSLKREYKIEQKQLGFRGITEAFAYYTQLLLLDKSFLSSLNVVEKQHLEELIDCFKWDFLRQLRLVCVKFLLAVKHMERDTYENLMNYTKNIMEETFLAHFPKELYWLYINNLEDSLAYVAGWIWGIQLRNHLSLSEFTQKKHELLTLSKDCDLPLVLKRENFNFLGNDLYQIDLKEVFSSSLLNDVSL